jgi:tRNA A37 threonylcarbamoyltransferase TsaD
VVSGGHTCLFDCPDPLNFQMLRGTIDDGREAFDKVAAALQLGFQRSGGRAQAASGDPKAFRFPRLVPS